MLARAALLATVVAAVGQAGPTAFTISGRVLDSRGRAPSRAALYLCAPREDGVSGCAPVDLSDEGHFTTPRVAPGSYALYVGAPEQPGPDDSSVEGGLAIVTVGAAHVTGIAIATRAYTLDGRFVMPDGRPLAGAPPQLHLLGQLVIGERAYAIGSKTALAGADGGFTIANLFGRRVLRAGYGTNAERWHLRGIRLDGRDVTDVPTDFSERPGARLEVVLSREPAARLQGTVTAADGRPAKDAWVVRFSADRALWTHWASTTGIEQTAWDGRFAAAVRPGRYLVAALPPTSFQVKPILPPLAALAPLATAVTVDEGGHADIQLRQMPVR